MTGNSIPAKIRSHLVEDYRRCWKWTTTHVAVVIGLVSAYFAEPSNWSSIASTFYSIPPEYRIIVPPVVGILVAFIPVALRAWKGKNG